MNVIRTVFLAAVAGAVLSQGVAAASQPTLTGSWNCYSFGRAHTSANLERTRFESNGDMVWSAFGQVQKYRYTYAGGVLTETGGEAPGPLKSRVSWLGTDAFRTTPLEPKQLGQTCTRSKK